MWRKLLTHYNRKYVCLVCIFFIYSHFLSAMSRWENFCWQRDIPKLPVKITSPNEPSLCWWNTSTVVVTFSLPGMHALVLPNIPPEHAQTFLVHSFLHDTPSLSQKANEPANSGWLQRGGCGGVVAAGQSTFPGRVSGAAHRFLSHIRFHFERLWIAVPLPLSCLLSTSLHHSTRP